MTDDKKIAEQDIDQYLEGKSDLSDIYAEGKTLKAPEHLEFAVKRMAREAEENDQSISRPVLGKNTWLLPLSIAATVVLAITLVFFVDFRQADKQIIMVKDEKPLSDTQNPVAQTASVDEPSASNTPGEELAQTYPLTTDRTNQSPTADVKVPTTKSSMERQEQLASKTPAPEQSIKDENDFELPAHLREVIQQTGATGSNELLPPDILKTWTREQWKNQVKDLKTAGNEKLAQKYIDEYPRYFSGEKFKP